MAPALSSIGRSGMAQLLLLSLLGQLPVATADGHTVTIHARLIDWYCWGRAQNGMLAPDGSNIMTSPSAHTAACLKLSNCKASGYYLAVKCDDGNFTPWYDLSENNATMAAVEEYVDSLSPSSLNDISVTVTGTNHNGVIEDAIIITCSGSIAQCDDGACSGACASAHTNMYGYPGCGADAIPTDDLSTSSSTSTSMSTSMTTSTNDSTDGGDLASFGIRIGIPAGMLMAVSVMASLVASV